MAAVASDVPVIVFGAVAALAAAMLAGCVASSEPLTLHPASAMVRIGGPSGVPVPEQASEYTLELAGGESEAVQVHVRLPAGLAADAGRPLRVQASVRPLRSAGWQPRIRTFQVLAVNHTGPAEHPQFKVPTRNVGWVPDVCWPTRRAIAQDHRPGELTFLFDVHAPMGQVGTRWLYDLEFHDADGRTLAAALRLRVRVLPFTLPTRLPFKTGVTWNWRIEKYLGRELTEAERRAYFDFFLRHRFTPAAFWSRGPAFSAEEVAFIAARGGNLFQIYGNAGKRLFTDKQKAALAPKLRQWRQMMDKAGALGDCYALVADEPNDSHIPVIRANAGFLKKHFPELRIWVATRPRKDLLDVVDCWDVVTAASTELYEAHSYTDQSMKLVRQAARRPEYWWFYSVEPYAPHANARLDDALVDSRAIGWMSFARGMDGFEYFWATDWAGNADLRDVAWPAKAAKWRSGLSGAGQLCYPGEKGLPMPSLRLINLRDGMEDWAAFVAAGKDLRQGRPADIRDPDDLADLRRVVNTLLADRPKGAQKQ